jgi:NitT/TauT family transport system ATP-binding protein
MSTLNKSFQIKNVSFELEDKTILQDISLTLADQKIYALIGASGAGKTTLLQLLGGLKEPTKGTLTYAEKSPKDVVISLVPQEYGLLPWQTARQAVLAGRKISQKQRLTQDDQLAVRQLFEQMQSTKWWTKTTCSDYAWPCKS